MYKILKLPQSHIYIIQFTASSLLAGSALTVTFIIRNITTESKMLLALIHETPFNTALFWLGISNDKIWVDTPRKTGCNECWVSQTIIPNVGGTCHCHSPLAMRPLAIFLHYKKSISAQVCRQEDMVWVFLQARGHGVSVQTTTKTITPTPQSLTPAFFLLSDNGQASHMVFHFTLLVLQRCHGFLTCLTAVSYTHLRAHET